MLPAQVDAVEFATLMVAPVDGALAAAEPAASAGPEVLVGSVTIRLEPGASAVRIASVVRADVVSVVSGSQEFQLDALKFQGSRSSMRLLGYPFAMASSVALR